MKKSVWSVANELGGTGGVAGAESGRLGGGNTYFERQHEQSHLKRFELSIMWEKKERERERERERETAREKINEKGGGKKGELQKVTNSNKAMPVITCHNTPEL